MPTLRRDGRILLAPCLGALTLIVTAGCSAANEDSAREAAAQFVTAIEEDDSARACELLAPDTVESLEPEDCRHALPSLELPNDPIAEVQVWGDAAQARTASDVLFLRELDDGWRVVAAGCQPQGEDHPYKCELERS